jgi:NTP pyrophosphatase (non-canonical NTP hydrolase)
MVEMKHSAMVEAIAKKGEDILKELSPLQAELIHMGLLICSEAGELADAIKQFAIYQKPMDMENVVEEMGDIEWTMERTRQLLNITRELTLDHNIEKLSKRYPQMSYSNEDAQKRADKNV